MIRLNLISIFILVHFFSTSQVEIDKRILFNSNDENNNNITNVGAPSRNDAGVSIESSFEMPLTFTLSSFISPTTINLTTINTNLLISKGLSLQFKVNQNNLGPIFISINNNGNYKLLKNVTEELTENDIILNQLIEIVFDGTNFQLLNLIPQNSCPDGFAIVNSKLCIEIDSHPEVNFFEAIKYCMDRNTNLCSWSEFSMSCNTLNSISNNFTDYWEWVSTTADHHNGARIVGFGGCNQANYTNAELTTARFRCSYNK